METILNLIFTFLKFYVIVGCIFTFIIGVVSFIVGTDEDYTPSEVAAMIFIYPIVIYHMKNSKENE